MRYLHQPLSELRRWSVAELEYFVDGAMQLIALENEATGRTEND
jgi:hypothetical protein